MRDREERPSIRQSKYDREGFHMMQNEHAHMHGATIHTHDQLAHGHKHSHSSANAHEQQYLDDLGSRGSNEHQDDEEEIDPDSVNDGNDELSRL